MSKLTITPFKAWMFGLAIAATTGVVAFVVYSLVDEGQLTGRPIFWLTVDSTMLLWIGAMASVIRDSILIQLEKNAAKIDARADRCRMVQLRLDEIEQEHAAATAAYHGGRRLHSVE